MPVGRSYKASFQDYGLQPGTSYSYQVEAYSASGYPSALSEAKQVTTAASSVNLALNQPYTSSEPTRPAYPDTDGKEMTNGKFGANYFWDPEWQGRSTEETPLVFSYTVDLGDSKRIEGLSIHFLQDLGSAIKLPRSVEYQVSEDNVLFTSLGESPFRKLNFGPTPPDQSSVSYGLLPTQTVTARYVKVIVTTSNYAWTFCDELLVEQYTKGHSQDSDTNSGFEEDTNTTDMNGSETPPGLFDKRPEHEAHEPLTESKL